MKKRCVLYQLFNLGLLLALSSHPNAAAETSPKDNTSRCLGGKDPRACYYAAHTMAAKGDQAGAEKFFRKGCDLGALESCHGLAGTLGQNGAIDEAERLSKLNCEKGYPLSCETAAYYLDKQGRTSEARFYYLKVCSSVEWPRGCSELASLSENKESRDSIKMECINGAPWACLVLGLAEKNAGNLQQAKMVLMESCQKYGAYSLCHEASNLIKAPADVEEYAMGQDECAHWGGEEGYDQDRRHQITVGAKRSCVDRSTKLETLTKKYQNQPEIIFKLQHAEKLNQI